MTDLIQTSSLPLDLRLQINKIATKSHPVDGSPWCEVTFNNGWGASILAGAMFYADGDGKTFEVACINPEGRIDYSLNCDVWGYQNAEEVTAILNKIAALPDAAPRKPNINMFEDMDEDEDEDNE